MMNLLYRKLRRQYISPRGVQIRLNSAYGSGAILLHGWPERRRGGVRYCICHHENDSQDDSWPRRACSGDEPLRGELQGSQLEHHA